ncbi:hypothetical protein [Thermomonas sp.]|uniref:hypothetical protein n=1 Tax=Thermomonas sp. TaxID=1971895 RepID=UPI00248782C3|nr:hypothetical protein [Thermomonas sp.]MDI1253194.1 hypothetical protein [Thermomonas sp.]
MALTRGGDVVLRLLTSRQHGRPELPPCYHGDPYPGFYLGVINAAVGLGSKSWLDLRGLEDADGIDMSKDLAAAVSSVVAALDNASLKAALQCTAAADDTTQTQEWAIRDQLAKLG